MDVSKAACVLAANPEIKDLRKSTITRAKVNGVPLFEILVSPASPRDFSYVSIIEDDAGRRKIVYREPMAVPQIIVWDDKVNDAALSVNYPYFAVASLAHAIESYVSKNSWAVSDSYALQAISLIGQNLSVCALGVLVNPDLTVKKSGGFIIQLLPGCPDEVIDQIENNINNIKSVTTMLDEGMSVLFLCSPVTLCCYHDLVTTLHL